MVIASEGGQLQLGDRVVLTIPPDALEEDTMISVSEAETPEIPQGVVALGRAYEFEPEGLQFAPGKPATVSMRLESVTGADVTTSAVYYAEPETGDLLASIAAIDIPNRRVTSSMEHFSKWIPMALGNSSPGAPIQPAWQSNYPTAPVLDAPLLVRAIIRDPAGLKTIVKAELYMRKTGGTFAKIGHMTPDTTVPGQALYTYLLNPGMFNAADMVTGTDYQLCLRITDNLNISHPVPTTSCTGAGRLRNLDFGNRRYQGAALKLNPNPAVTPHVVSGFQIQYFLESSYTDIVLGTTATFRAVPTTVTSNVNALALGRNNASGLTWTAKEAGLTSITLSWTGGAVTTPTLTQDIQVDAGAVASIALLDGTVPGSANAFAPCSGPVMEFCIDGSGQIAVKEGKQYQFDVVGLDTYGNPIALHPGLITFTSSAGQFTATPALFDTTGTSGVLTVDASVAGTMQATANLSVTPRTWMQVGGTVCSHAPLDSFVAGGGQLFVSCRPQSSGYITVNVKTWDGTAWVDLPGGAVPISASSSSLGYYGGSLYIAVVDNYTTGSLMIFKNDGVAWTLSHSIAGSFESIPQMYNALGKLIVLYNYYDMATGLLTTRAEQFDGTSWSATPISMAPWYSARREAAGSPSGFWLYDRVTESVLKYDGTAVSTIPLGTDLGDHIMTTDGGQPLILGSPVSGGASWMYYSYDGVAWAAAPAFSNTSYSVGGTGYGPRLTFWSGRPFVAVSNVAGGWDLELWTLNGPIWERVGSPVATHQKYDMMLRMVSYTPYLAYRDGAGGADDIKVSVYQ